VRSQGEGEGPHFDGSGQVELLGTGPSLLEEIEGAGQQLAPSRQVESVDPRGQLHDHALWMRMCDYIRMLRPPECHQESPLQSGEGSEPRAMARSAASWERHTLVVSSLIQSGCHSSGWTP
jgi:hypothetical protein